MARRGGRYAPVLAVLAALPAAQPSVRLTFAELAALLSHPLPPTAHTTSYWTHSRVAAANWQRHGWGARLDRSGPAVVFTRQPRPA